MIPVQLADVKVTKDEVNKWLRSHHLKRTRANITRATNALKAEKQKDALPLGRDISFSGSDVSRQVIYGECRVGGTISFLDSRAGNRYLDIVVTLATHEIEAVDKLYLDDCEVIFGATPDGRWSTKLRKPDGTEIAADHKVFMAINSGTDGQSAQADLVSQNSKWTSAHKQSGCAHAYVILVWDAAIFGDGIPEISFLVRGKKVRDPRTGTTYYTNNAALCAADYLTDTRIGVGVDVSYINDSTSNGSLEDAADVCDEDVALSGGGTENRYTINGYFSTDESHGRVLERMAAAMGGAINNINGFWNFWPGAWRSPVLSLTEDDIKSPIRVQTLTAREDVFNSVRGVFVSSASGYIETDYPAVKNSTYITQDGEEIWENIDYHFVTSASGCQRLSKLELERIRQGIQVEFFASLRCYQVKVGENVTLTFSRYGWSSKTFEVVKADLVLSQSGSAAPELLVDLVLRETAEGVFDWSAEETTYDVAPNTNLPSPFSVADITGLTLASGTPELYQRGDGTVAPRIKVSWNSLSDFFVSSGGEIGIKYRPSGGFWVDAANVPGDSTFTYLIDITDGQYYDVRVRAINAFGIAGAEAEVVNHFVVGKTQPPSNVMNFAGAVTDYGIQLAWQNITDIDLAYYEIREGSSWETGTLISKIQTTRLALELRETGTYMFWIAAVDTSRNYSSSPTSATVVVATSTIPNPTSQIDGPNVIIDWDDAIGGSWATEDYSLYYGSTFAGATFIASTKTTIFTLRASWAGIRKFWIEARDIYGNRGTPVGVEVNILAPGVVPSLVSQVVDNNVLLSWATPSIGSLPVDHYDVYRGDVFATATLIGQTASTYSAFFELVSSSYTYWLVAVDTAGNEGTETPTLANVGQPIDFTLITNESLTLTDADSTNVLLMPDGTLIMPVNTSETWEDHFINNSWTTAQDQIDDGYPIYIQPTPSTALYSQTLDIGTLISQNVLVTATILTETLASGLTLTPQISVSDDGMSWTDFAGVTSAFASNFQYVKVELAASGGDVGLVQIKEVRIVVSVKLRRDSGTVFAEASDVDGTAVNFNLDFIDVVGPPHLTCNDLVRGARFNNTTTDYLSRADHADFEPGNGDFSCAGWVYFLGGLSSSNTQAVIGKWQTIGQREWLLFYSGSSNSLRVQVSPDGTNSTPLDATNFGPPVLNQWMFVCFWHDATADKIGIRINQTAKNETAHSTGIFTGTSRLQLGGIDGAIPMDGLMKNWHFWKGRVLSSSDIDELYNAGFQKYSELSSGIKTSMISFWELGEGSGTREDSHGSHDLSQTGTVSGQVLPVSGIASFVDAPNPTGFDAFLFTDSLVRVSGNAAWRADGYVV